MIRGHLVTLRRFVRTFLVGAGRTLSRRGGGHHRLDAYTGPARGEEPVIRQGAETEGLFTVEYPDERLPVAERFRVLPVLIYDDEDGHVRCTCCNICAKVCPPQCIWMTQAHGPSGKPVPRPSEFFIDMDVCMNCGLCAEYCPFDAIKMDQDFELSNYERHQTHIYSLQDLLVSGAYYARTHPEAWSSEEEEAERRKVASKKDRRDQKANAAGPGRRPEDGVPAP
jgi:NADH-quinone oxidoreductase subunit I